MKVLEIILPVLVMILLGMACKRLKLLDQNGINNMKLLVTQIMLPVAIFQALATAEYNKETGILVGIMFVMLVVSFSIGFLLFILCRVESVFMNLSGFMTRTRMYFWKSIWKEWEKSVN